MDTRISGVVRAAPGAMYELVAAVEDWPRLLEHYRWVRVIGHAEAGRRVVEMAARRDVVGQLGVPLRWTAVQTLDPVGPRVEFEHVAGPTRGMWVAWTFERQPVAAGECPASLVQVRHVFKPAWPVPGPALDWVVGEVFVNAVARRTLAHLGERAERGDRAERPS